MRQFVGVGGDCQVAYQVGRLWPDSEKHFFDSIVSPIDAAIRLVENRFAEVLQTSDMEPHWTGDTLERVTDTKYGIWHVHELGTFTAEDKGRIQSKYSYLGRKFAAMMAVEAPVTYIRRWHYIDGADTDELPRQLLATLRRHNNQAELLYLHGDSDRLPVKDGPFGSAFLRQAPGMWAGIDEAWDEIAAYFGLNGSNRI